MIVELPNGQELEFPDGTSPDVMRQAIYNNFPEYAKQEGQEAQEEAPEEETGFGGIMSDIGESLSNVPGAIGDFLENLPGQLKQSGSQIIHHPIRAAENVGAGLLEGLKGAVNIPSNVASYLDKKDIGRGGIEDFIKKLNIGDTGLEKAVLGEGQPGDELLRGIGSFAPYAKLGGLAKGLGGAAKRAGAAGLYGAGQNQDPLVAALLGLATEGTVKGAQKLTRKGTFLPNSPLSNAELEEAAQITKGTDTDLGNVIENPYLKRQYENVLPEIPMSGAHAKMQKTAQVITDRGEQLLNSLKGDFEGKDIGQSLQKALKEAESETRQTKNQKYKALNEAAEQEGVTTPRSNLRQIAAEELEKIKEDPDLARLADKEVMSLLESISKESKKEGEPGYSLKQTDFLRGKLGQRAHDAYMSNSPNSTELGTIYKTLKEAADKDIDQAIDTSGKDNLKSLRDEAFKFYKEEYAPYEDPDILKFTRKGGDADTLAQYFIRNSKISDRANILGKLTQKLPVADRDLLAYSYLSKAIEENGTLNPSKLRTLFTKNLGERQREALFNPEMIKNLSNYSKLVQKNTDALNTMFNPKTGQRGLSALVPALTTGVGALATGSIPVTLLSAIAPSLIAKPIVKALTNPTMREKLIQRMIEARTKNAKPSRNIAPFAQALTESSQTHKPLELELTKYFRKKDL